MRYRRADIWTAYCEPLCVCAPGESNPHEEGANFVSEGGRQQASNVNVCELGVTVAAGGRIRLDCIGQVCVLGVRTGGPGYIGREKPARGRS